MIKINYDRWIMQSWFMDWIEDQLGQRLSNLVFGASLNLDKKLSEPQMQRRIIRLQKFMPKGWSIEYQNSNVYLLVNNDIELDFSRHFAKKGCLISE